MAMLEAARPITDKEISISGSGLRRILEPRFTNVPREIDTSQIRKVTASGLSSYEISAINRQLQKAIKDGSILVYKTDLQAHILDTQTPFYTTISNYPIPREYYPDLPTRLNIETGSNIDARFYTSKNIAFFKVSVDGNQHVLQFNKDEPQNAPQIYEIPKDAELANLVFAYNPYRPNFIIPCRTQTSIQKAA